MRCAFIPSRVSAIEASVVSAPSDTSTTPATGSPASSSRAPSSAGASLVCEPLNVRSSTDVMRPVDEEKRKVRTRNRSASDFISGLSALPNCCRTYSARGLPSWSAICMLRESSSSTATTFC